MYDSFWGQPQWQEPACRALGLSSVTVVFIEDFGPCPCRPIRKWLNGQRRTIAHRSTVLTGMPKTNTAANAARGATQNSNVTQER